MSVRTRASSPGGTLIQSGTLAARPAAGVANRYYWATDVWILFRDTGVAWEIAGATQYRRFLRGLWSDDVVYGNVTPNTARVYLTPIEVPFTVTVEAISICYGAFCAGNIKGGIYADNGDTPVGGALLQIASSVAKAGANLRQDIALDAVLRLTPGLYWAAVVSDENLTQLPYSMWGGAGSPTPTTEYYDLVAYANPLTNPCPATNPSGGPILYLRVSSIP